MAEVNDLQQIVAHGPARFAVGEVSFDAHLLAKLQRAVNII
jgi:hypothetical protein